MVDVNGNMISRRAMLAGSAGAAMVAFVGAGPASQSGMIAFSGARIIDGNGRRPIEGGVMLVESGRVIAVGDARSIVIPAAAQRHLLTGKTIMPMLIDAHTHVGIVEGAQTSPDNDTPAAVDANLATFRRYGVAAILVMGTDRTPDGIRARLRHANLPQTTQPATAGTGFGVPGGYPPATMIGAPWIARPTTPQEARTIVRSLCAQSPDIVKLWVDSGFGEHPTMDRAISAAIIDEAHRNGVRAAAHIFYLEDARALVDQGLDVLAHSVRDLPVDDAFLSQLQQRGVAYITTLALDESEYVYADDPPPAYTAEPAFVAALEPGVAAKLNSDAYKQHKRSDPATPKWRAAAVQSKHNALRVQGAGVTVALGTDSGATFERIRGFDTHRELELLVTSGLSPLEAIRCGTVNAARVLGPRAADFGALEAGKYANFVVLDTDPTADITATRRMSQIWQGGTRVPSWQDRA